MVYKLDFSNPASWLHHPCWLWVGPNSLYMQEAAKTLAYAILSKGDHNPQGGDPAVVTHGIQSGFYPNLLWVKKEDASTEITIEALRRTLVNLSQKPALPGWRVVVIQDPLNIASTNSLLKTLEEPPSLTFFITLTQSLGRVLPTLRSRCQHVRIEPEEKSSESDLSWGEGDWQKRIELLESIDVVQSWLKQPPTSLDVTNLKNLILKDDPWLVLDIFRRMAYQEVKETLKKDVCIRWWHLSNWYRSAQESHLDPAHSLIEGLRIWHDLK